MNYRNACIILMSLAAFAPWASAQRGGGRGREAARGARPEPRRPVDITAKNSFDMASVERGGKIFAAQCASCHGADARGGASTKTDVDLLRSEIVVMDHSGANCLRFWPSAVPRSDAEVRTVAR